MSEITLQEQIEAVDAEIGYRSTFNLRHPSVEGTRHLVRLEAVATTLRQVQKYGFGPTRIVEARLEPSKWDD